MKTLLRYASIVAFSYSTLWAQAADENLTVQLPGGVPLDLVWISPNTFTMGTTEDQKSFMDSLGRGEHSPTTAIVRYTSLELPAHQVTLTQGFYVGKFEVTRAQWRAVMETISAGKSVNSNEDKELDIPEVGISWFDAQKFMTKLNEAAGDTLYRLPTEAEWECACRGGTTTLWFTGDDPSGIDKYINYGQIDPFYKAMPVGSLLPNPYGLYDMGGNVLEWVLDDLGAYSAIPQVDLVGAIPQSEQDEVRPRGGAAGVGPSDDREHVWQTRCAYRFFLPRRAGVDDAHLGFRVLRRGTPATAVEESTWGKVKGKWVW